MINVGKVDSCFQRIMQSLLKVCPQVSWILYSTFPDFAVSFRFGLCFTLYMPVPAVGDCVVVVTAHAIFYTPETETLSVETGCLPYSHNNIE